MGKLIGWASITPFPILMPSRPMPIWQRRRSRQGGGRFLVRGDAVKAYEAGLAQRVVIIEFGSVVQAIATHDGEAYQAALRVFDNAAIRDVRIIEGLT